MESCCLNNSSFSSPGEAWGQVAWPLPLAPAKQHVLRPPSLGAAQPVNGRADVHPVFCFFFFFLFFRGDFGQVGCLAQGQTTWPKSPLATKARRSQSIAERTGGTFAKKAGGPGSGFLAKVPPLVLALLPGGRLFAVLHKLCDAASGGDFGQVGCLAQGQTTWPKSPLPSGSRRSRACWGTLAKLDGGPKARRPGQSPPCISSAMPLLGDFGQVGCLAQGQTTWPKSPHS